jgi:uncharacterized protein
MSQQLPTKPSSKKLIKLLTKSIKETVDKKEIDPTTRKGNKELSLLVKQIVTENLRDKEQAIKYGEQLGEIIAKFSQKHQKKYLDKGVIRQIALQKQLPSLPETAPEQTKPTVTNTTTQKTPKTETPIVEEKATPEKASQPVEKPSETNAEIPVQEKEPASKQDSNSMSLKDRINEDIKLAMKAKDKIRLETVRSIKKVLLEKEVSVRPSGQESLTPEQELEVLTPG